MIGSFVQKVISLIAATLMLLPTLVTDGYDRAEADKAAQIERIAQLESAYANGEMPKINEANFVAGDLNKALENGVKFNELSFVATHNSYQTESLPAFRQIFANLSTLTFGLVSGETGGLDSQTLTEQFNNGIRSIELDIETVKDGDDVSFTCMHSPTLDMTTTCYDFELTLKEIKMWSDYNPDHLPVTIIVEPKQFFIPMEGMRFFNIDYALKFDELLRSALGDKLFTPKDMLRDYESFADMRFADDWCEVEDMLGKVVVLLHDTGITQDYIELDESLKTQAMFPMLRYEDKDLSYAGFLLINEPEEALEYSREIIEDYNLIVRTQVDTYTSVSREMYDNAMASGAQILSTDYPVRSDLQDGDYYVSFGDYKTVKIK